MYLEKIRQWVLHKSRRDTFLARAKMVQRPCGMCGPSRLEDMQWKIWAQRGTDKEESCDTSEETADIKKGKGRAGIFTATLGDVF